MNNKDFDNLPVKPVEVEGKPKPAGDFLEEYYKSLGDGTMDYLGIKTGLAELDNKTLGLDGLIVLAGRAGQGKTSLALQLAFGACELGTPTVFYSLEMPRRAIFTKIFNRLAEVKYTDILLKGKPYLEETEQDGTGQKEQDNFNKCFTKEQTEKLKQVKERIKKMSHKFYIRSLESKEADITFESVEREINLIKAEHNAEKVFVVIDQLNDFDLKIEEYRDQLEKEGKRIREFKKISEQTGATILLIAHKNKAEYKGDDITSVKGSVDLIYKPEIVMILGSEGEKQTKDDKDLLNNIIANTSGQELKKIDLMIVKNRYNAPTTIKLDFNGEYSIFTEREK